MRLLSQFVEGIYESEENYLFLEKNGQTAFIKTTNYEKAKTGHVSEKTIYSCEDCSGCPYKTKCIRGNNCKNSMEDRTKNIQVSKVFKEKREKDLERITSKKVHEIMSFVKVHLFYEIPQYFNKNEYRFTQKRLRINCF